MTIEIRHGNSLDIMKEYPDNYFDLCLTDPPYGLNYDKHAHKAGGTQYGKAAAPKNEYLDTEWDKSIPDKMYFDELRRISKNQIIFGGEHVCLQLPKSRGWLVWDKLTGANNFSDCELCWSSYNRPVKKYTYMWNGMLQENMANKEKRYHPTQKPVELLSWMLRDYTAKGQLILDCFAGSFSTAIACERMGRNCVGIEISEEYCEIARKRVQEEKAKMGLFNGEMA